jgi:ArsR family transcriptional regulator
VQNIFKALSDETRLRILSVIMQGEMCVCEIEQALDLTQSNASRHLTVLKNAGIIRGVKHAQWMYYSMDEDFSRNNGELFTYLTARLKELKSYENDTLQCVKCRCSDLCKE